MPANGIPSCCELRDTSRPHSKVAAVLSPLVGHDALGGGRERLHCCPIRTHPPTTCSNAIWAPEHFALDDDMNVATSEIDHCGIKGHLPLQHGCRAGPL
jgi:hypothetical protein